MQQWLSPTEEQTVVAMLNRTSALGYDWRGLADRLRYSSVEMMIFEQSGNPCKELLQAWSATGKRSRTVLIDHLRDLERVDLVNFLAASTTGPFMPTIGASPLIAAQQQKTAFSTVAHMLQNNGLLNGLFVVMDEEEAWLLLLKQRNLLAGAGMQSFVSGLRSKWAQDRSGEPSKTVVTSAFSSIEFNDFCI